VDEDIRTYLDASRYREAFELLLDRYQHKAFRLAYSMLGDEASAEEMAQDTFLQIWKALPSFRGDASLSTWVYAITRNRCLTGRKKLRERRAVSIEACFETRGPTEAARFRHVVGSIIAAVSRGAEAVLPGGEVL